MNKKYFLLTCVATGLFLAHSCNATKESTRKALMCKAASKGVAAVTCGAAGVAALSYGIEAGAACSTCSAGAALLGQSCCKDIVKLLKRKKN